MTVKNSDLVSIIIPAYNTAPYIHRAIESSLSQTHTNIEALVIDDGSSDDTLKIARSYSEKDSRIRVFTQKNSGVSVARNKGISEARGKYIVFLDSDDWLELDAVEIMLAAQNENPDRLVAVNYWVVHDDRTRDDILLRSPKYNVPSRKLSVKETIYAEYSSNNSFPETAWAKIYSAEVIRRNNLKFREGIHYGEDQLFAFEYLIRTSGSVYVDRPLFNILKRSGSAMHTPYAQQKKNSQDWVSLVQKDPAITEELNEAVRVYCGGAYFKQVREAIFLNWEHEVIQRLREETKPFVRDIISCGKISFVKKVYLLCVLYCPDVIAKAAILTWELLKLRRKKEEDIIPRW